MLRSTVESSNVHSVAWENDTLYVTFKRNMVTYRYPGAPITTYNEMVEAPSPGKYLNANVIPRFVGTPL